ncbi:MAG: M15 family metallopeptidase [Treponema sp.]|nr:M15 family metallopeptidase [Treponema sp.]
MDGKRNMAGGEKKRVSEIERERGQLQQMKLEPMEFSGEPASGELQYKELSEQENPIVGEAAAAVDEAEVEPALAAETAPPAESQGEDTSTNLSQNDKDKINTLHPEIRDNVTKMLQNLRKDGVTVEITLAYRSYEEQDALYAKGRDGKGKVIDASKVVTNAKGGQSYHNFGLTFDLTVYDKNGKKDWSKDSDAWKKVIAEGKRQGFDAGAEWIDFPDLPHFEKTFGLTPKKLREKKEKNDTKDGFVNVK